LNYYRCLRQLARRIDLSAVDVVHVHAPVPAFLLQRLFGVSCFYTAHTPVGLLASENTAGSNGTLEASGIGGKLAARIERDVIRRSRLTIALGDYLKPLVPDANIETIASGLDAAAWPPIDRDAARRSLGIAADAFVVLFAGRMASVKGIEVLLDATERLASTSSRLEVLIIGPLSGSFDTRDESVAPYARALMERARDLPVRFLGFISNRDARFKEHFAAADLFVLPSLFEPQGLVVLESLVMGTPVIGSATGGIPAMVSPEVGCLFPPGDAGALADCIRELDGDRGRLETMQSAARPRVESMYSWQRSVDRYLEAFHRSLTDFDPSCLRSEG
jgi:glycosyltransferase involved in cell wall biosynthesis